MQDDTKFSFQLIQYAVVSKNSLRLVVLPYVKYVHRVILMRDIIYTDFVFKVTAKQLGYISSSFERVNNNSEIQPVQNDFPIGISTIIPITV